MQINLTLLQDILFQSDKIFSVLAVVLVVFGGVLFLLIRQERKLNKLESQIEEKEQSHS